MEATNFYQPYAVANPAAPHVGFSSVGEEEMKEGMEQEERDRSSKSHISRTIVMESNRTVTNQTKNDRSDRQKIHRAITGAKRNEGRETLRSNSSSATINNIQRQHNV
jgi:hypothetical protein